MPPWGMKPLWRWTRLTSTKWEEEWAERLQFLGPGRVAMIGWPNSKSVRIETFCDETTARRLVRNFGGRMSRARDWTADMDRPRKPLSIRGRIVIHSDEASFRNRKPSRGRTDILIPAGMAFGTGDHATTASCLRMLCDVTRTMEPGWRAIDAGTGSGILAIAAAHLGAGHVEAFDFDPASVRIAKANARANGIKSISIAKADVLEWRPKQPAEIVMANLFSDLLIKAAPRLKSATKRGGALIFSGVLRTQLDEVVRAFGKQGFAIERTVVRGKWSAGLGHRI